MTQPPKRLLETESGALRESLSSAKSQLPSDAQLAQLAERLGRLGIVVPRPEAPSPPAPSPSKSLGAGAKAALGVGGVGTAVLLAFALTPASEAPPEPPSPRLTPTVEVRSSPPPELRSSAVRAPHSVARPSELPSRSPERDEAMPDSPPPAERTLPNLDEPKPEVRAPAPPREPSSAPVERRAELARPLPAPAAERAATAPGGATPKADLTPPSEVDLLKRARDSVVSNPAQALALARRHGTEFPNGAFAQERDFIAISALVRLGRTGEARTQASSFRARYRRSAYLPQLDRLLGREP